MKISGLHQQQGYVMEVVRGHPLADKRGRVLQHRRIVYGLIGPGPHPCFYCSKLLEWTTGRKSATNLGIEIDHIDGDRTNNNPTNWVITCTGCNTRKPQKGDHRQRVYELLGVAA